MTDRSRTRILVTLGMLAAVQIVLSRFLSINAWNIRIGFGFLPVAIAGILFGPAPAAAMAAVSDMLGAMLFSTGVFLPITVTSALNGMVYGLFLHKKQGPLRILGATLITKFVLSLLLNTFWISLLNGSPYLPLLATRLVQNAVVAPVEFVVLLLAIKPVLYCEKRLSA